MCVCLFVLIVMMVMGCGSGIFSFLLVAACGSFIVVVANGAVFVPVIGVKEGLWLASSMATCVVASPAVETDETELMPVLWVRGSE